MKKREIRIIRKNGAKTPEYKTPRSSGCDVYALIGDDESVVINPGGRLMIHTGIYLDLPYDIEVQVRPRSGLAFKDGVTLVNAPGTIDSDYQGECNILLINHSDKAVFINDGDRIGQFVFVENVVQAEFVDVEDFANETERGAGGFGHTGK